MICYNKTKGGFTMQKRILHTLALLLALLAIPCLAAPALAADSDVSPTQSVITTGANNTVVDPYQSFNYMITLKNAQSTALSATPTGKVYVWATDQNDLVTSGLNLVNISVPDGVFIHETARKGVFIMDAKALSKTQKMNFSLSATGTYELHSLYMPTGSIDPNNVTNYWPYELTGGSVAARTIKVNPTPAADVATMIVSTKIRGISVDSFLIANPRNQTTNTPISIDANAATPTEVQLALLRDNGLPVGRDVPVYISSNTASLSISNVMVRTDANGIARFKVNGIIDQNAKLQLRCSLADTPVTIPLKSYTYRPEKVRLTIGSNAMDVDGRIIEIDSAACVKDNRTFVPFRAISELLGARVDYDSNVNSIVAIIDGTRLTMSIGYNHYAVNGTVYQMDTAPFVSNNRTMVPIRFVAEVMGYDVNYLPGTGGAAGSVVFTRQ